MIILDTDHVTELYSPHNPRYDLLVDRLVVAEAGLTTTIVTVEEQMRGWLSIIHGLPNPRKQIPRYRDLQNLFEFFACWEVLPFDDPAVDEFLRLRGERIRLATMDLKIASMALVAGSLIVDAKSPRFPAGSSVERGELARLKLRSFQQQGRP